VAARGDRAAPMRCRRTARRTRPPPTTRRAVVHRRRGRPARRRRRATNESAAEPNHLPNNQDRLAGCVMHFPRLICHLAPDTRHAIDTLPTRYVATPGRNDATATSAFVAPTGLTRLGRSIDVVALLALVVSDTRARDKFTMGGVGRASLGGCRPRSRNAPGAADRAACRGNALPARREDGGL
jgi:hypothetical protein